MRVLSPIGDVVGDRVVEQERILRDQSDLLAQGSQVGHAQIHAIDHDGAVIGIVEARQEAEQRGFAAAVLADQGDGLAVVDGQVDAGEDRMAGRIGKADVLEDDGGMVSLQMRPGAVGVHLRLLGR